MWKLHSNKITSFALDTNTCSAGGRVYTGSRGQSEMTPWNFTGFLETWLFWYEWARIKSLKHSILLFFFFNAAFWDAWKSMSMSAKLTQKLFLCSNQFLDLYLLPFMYKYLFVLQSILYDTRKTIFFWSGLNSTSTSCCLEGPPCTPGCLRDWSGNLNSSTWNEFWKETWKNSRWVLNRCFICVGQRFILNPH